MKPIFPIAAAIAFTATFLRTTSKGKNSTARKIVTRAASVSGGGGGGSEAGVTNSKQIMNIPKPVCKRIDHAVSFGIVPGENRGENVMDPAVKVNDDLFWLRDDDRKNEEILSYLKTENEYTEAHTKHLKKKETDLYNEIVKAIEETDVDVKFQWGDSFEYYVRTVKGKSYPIVCRQERTNTTKGGGETIVLDVNELAKQMSYCSIGGFNMSASHNLLAYGVDETGYETYRIKVRNVKTGEEMPIDVLEGTTGSVSWNGDSQLFYTTMDDAHRPNKVWRHNIGTPQSEDECLLSEDDELYNIGFGKSDNGNFLILESQDCT